MRMEISNSSFSLYFNVTIQSKFVNGPVEGMPSDELQQLELNSKKTLRELNEYLAIMTMLLQQLVVNSVNQPTGFIYRPCQAHQMQGKGQLPMSYIRLSRRQNPQERGAMVTMTPLISMRMKKLRRIRL